jgi:hypothetical protein
MAIKKPLRRQWLVEQRCRSVPALWLRQSELTLLDFDFTLLAGWVLERDADAQLTLLVDGVDAGQVEVGG